MYLGEAGLVQKQWVEKGWLKAVAWGSGSVNQGGGYALYNIFLPYYVVVAFPLYSLYIISFPAQISNSGIPPTMQAKTNFVQHGIWINYDLPQWRAYQVLLTDETTQIISNAIAVALSLTLPRFLRIIKLFLPKESKQGEASADSTASQALNTIHEGSRGSSRIEQNGNQISSRTHRIMRTREENSNANPASLLDHEHGQVNEEDDPDHPLPSSIRFPSRIQLPIPHFESRIESNFIGTITSAETFESAAAQLATDHLGMEPLVLGETTRTRTKSPSKIWKNFKEEKLAFTLISAIIFMLFGVFIGVQVVSISVAGIISDSTGLSISPKCGNWRHFGSNNTELWLYVSGSLAAAQQRATEYVDNCYYDLFAAGECQVYNNRTIFFSEKHNASCPFGGDVCLYGQSSAYTLDTGWVDSNVLGINAPRRYHFRRRTTCSPIVTNYSYIIPVNRDGFPQLGEYYYGKDETSSLSMTQPVDFGWGNVDYEHTWGYSHFRMHGTSLYGAAENRDILRQEFQPPIRDVSLFFIRPRALLYSQSSDDPIFPAQILAYDGLNYINNLPYATVLGCADTAEVSDPLTNKTWIPRNFTSWKTTSAEWSTDEMKKQFFLLSLALGESSTWQATDYGVRLDAEKKIVAAGDGVSLPLAREQWKVESRRFFEISLAMMQGKIYDIVRGRDADEPHLVNTLDEFTQPICNMVKFPTVGWTNISLFWLVLLPSCAFFLWFGTIEVEEKLIKVWFCLKVLKPCYQQIIEPCLKAIVSALNWFVYQFLGVILRLVDAVTWALERFRETRQQEGLSLELQNRISQR